MMNELIRAIDAAGYTKGGLLKLVYGSNYQGIDSALPQSLVDAEGYRYGHEDYRKNLVFLAMDCRKSPWKVLNVLDDMPIIKAHAIVRRVTLVHIVLAEKRYLTKEERIEYDEAGQLLSN